MALRISKNQRVAVLAAGVSLAMLGLAFASVPLYRLFCQVTGYAGTTQRAERAPARQDTRTVTIRFDANIAADLPWTFVPVQSSIQVHLGEQALAKFRVTSKSPLTTTGSATHFNVTPEASGLYFSKIDCFCFNSQTLKPGESAELPVTFFVDPELARDPDTASIREITLSYTFFKAEPAAVGQQASVRAGQPTIKE